MKRGASIELQDGKQGRQKLLEAEDEVSEADRCCIVGMLS